MSTYSNLRKLDQVDHLDAETEKHAKDAESRKAYLYNYDWHEAYNLGPPSTCRYPSVGKGIRMNAKGNELTPEQHKELHVRLIEERSWYWKDYKKRNGELGRHRQKKKSTRIRISKKPGSPPTGTAIHTIAINFRPDHSLALSMMDKQKIRCRDAIKQIAYDTAGKFSKATGYEAVAVNIHAADGNLHFHISYSDVDENNELLHQNRGRGRKGIKRLTDHSLALNRINRTGIHFPSKSMAKAIKVLNNNTSKGKMMIDWELTTALDDTMDRAKDALRREGFTHISKCFDDGRDAWERHITRRFSETKDGIEIKYQAEKARADKALLSAAEYKRESDKRQAELESLKQENAKLQAQLAVSQVKAKGQSSQQVKPPTVTETMKNLDPSVLNVLGSLIQNKNQSYRKDPPSKQELEIKRVLNAHKQNAQGVPKPSPNLCQMKDR